MITTKQTAIASQLRALAAATLCAVIFAAWFLRSYFSMFVIAGTLAYLFYPLYKRQLQMIAVNIRTLTELSHLFLPAMVTQKRGKIMNLGSVASFLPGPGMSVYFASKNYVLRFSEALAEELRGSGVTVTCLCPGPTKTNFGDNAQVSETHSTANPKTTAREVAEFGWYHMQAGTRVAVYGRGNRVMLHIARFVPRTLLTKLARKIQG